MYKIQIAKLGIVEYAEGLMLQESLLKLRQQDAIEDTLLLLEHPPVLTLGIRGGKSNILVSEEELKRQGVTVFNVSRGGDVTYHGPGQLVGYPIMKLSRENIDLKAFVQNIQTVFSKLLQHEYHIHATIDEKKYTGVWVGDKKITAIGIAVKRFVTMHGFAFNINTDLEHFKWINPCGITDKGVTSLEKITGEKQDMCKLTQQVSDYFCDLFNAEAVPITKEELYQIINEVN